MLFSAEVSFSLACIQTPTSLRLDAEPDFNLVSGSVKMKLQCDVEVVNRMLPTFGMKSRGKGARAVLSIGKHLDKTSQRSSVYMMICTAKDRAGSKYKVSVSLY